MCAFWLSLCRALPTRQGNILKFEDGTLWGDDVAELYERPCYIEIYLKILNMKAVLLKGTPGIGKSLFIFWFIYKLVLQAKENDGAIPTFIYRNRKGEEYFLSSSKDCVTTVSRSKFGMVADFHISDTNADSTAHANKLCMHVCSVHNVHFKEYLNNVVGTKGGFGIDFHMPTYSISEVEEYFGAKQQRSVLLFLYDVFGGSLRLINQVLVRKVSSSAGAETELIEEELKYYFSDELVDGASLVVLMKTLNISGGTATSIWSNCVNVISSILRSLGEKDSSTNDIQLVRRSLFRHYIVEKIFDSDCEAWSSGFMKSLAGCIVQKANSEILKELRNVFGNSGMGVMFEREAFRELYENLKDGRQYEIKKMFASGTTRPDLFSVQVTRRVFIRSIDDIKQLKDGEVGVPTICNFPLVDFVLKPNWFLQMTEAETKHSGAVGKLGELRNALGGDHKKHKMLFVLNNTKNYAGFKYDNEMSSILQYKVGFGATAKSEKKRKATQSSH